MCGRLSAHMCGRSGGNEIGEGQAESLGEDGRGLGVYPFWYFPVFLFTFFAG